MVNAKNCFENNVFLLDYIVNNGDKINLLYLALLFIRNSPTPQTQPHHSMQYLYSPKSSAIVVSHFLP